MYRQLLNALLWYELSEFTDKRYWHWNKKTGWYFDCGKENYALAA